MPAVAFTARDPASMVPMAYSGGNMRVLLMISLGLLLLAKTRSISPAIAPSKAPKIWYMAPSAPNPSPAFPPRQRGNAANHGRVKRPHIISPTPFSPSKENCEEITCSDPLTRTPIGSPCGCVYPIKVVMDVGVAPILLFPEIAELEIEVAAGTFLKQSQVRIMGADASIYNQDTTTVSIYLVPLGEIFDKMTALLIYDRFWQKKVRISAAIFGDYDVIYVHYPGLPSSPPPMNWASSDISPSGSQQYPFTANVPPGKKPSMNKKIIVLVAVSSFLLILVCVGVALIILKLKKLEQQPVAANSLIGSLTKRSGGKSTIQSSVASSSSMSVVSTVVTGPSSVKTFLLAELEKATDGFSSERVLGEGGFGCVYHGIMENGDEVAVKLLTREENGDREFIGEVEMLSRLHHRNLVKLIGICIEGHKRCLVYELVRNGSVESHLHGADLNEQNLNWDARMKIALGAARGLAYLHEDSNPRVIHRDFKASNVLLEEDFTPKVSDFGLAKEASDASHHISTRVMGTFGYVAPEYAMTGHLLVKSDVYSYGVVLLELLTGRKPVYMSCAHEPENLVTWARPLLTSKEGLEQLIDPSLQETCNFNDFARVAAVASMCVHAEAPHRPFMGEVVQALKLIYDDMDETNGDAYSHRGSSSCQDCDYKCDFALEGSWWSGGSPRLKSTYSLVNMEYSSDRIEEMHRPHSTSSLVQKKESLTGYNRSGPLRTKRRSVPRRLRNTMSEHGTPKRQLNLGG
ncbi:Receptor-like serine/threonine-protein kinase ALE2 [Platanthera guangdongensis]|uniref:Receptor-like serine/threonine-protein kinase ALE2 n=1 Tax=Platanthera guangdongensis TaxID=2320717 RepID=A0ABR2LSL5_9ASPA